MCGITCLISVTPRPLGHILRSMTTTIAHRGPDDEGYLLLNHDTLFKCYGNQTNKDAINNTIPWAANVNIDDTHNIPTHVGLGHRRLSIVDTSPLGHQPMSYEKGRFWISYNGEIYNYAELRVELEKFGHSFLTKSDTEVILAAYSQWGSACLNRFNGMWSFVIVDRKKSTLFVARDRYGIKPLYYYQQNDGLLAFVSEIKQLDSMPSWRAKVNSQGAWDFLVWNVTDHSDETLFQNVHQFPAGHFIEFSYDKSIPFKNGKSCLATQVWYTPDNTRFEGSLDEAAQQFRELITDSVRLQLRADVPIGSCLSGGLDSSTLVCLMNQLLSPMSDIDQRTFSACSNIADVDESHWIRKVVESTGVQNSQVIPTVESLFENMRDLAWIQDEPYGSTSIFAQWSVFRLAGESGTKVILDGQGADEQLAGYHVFMAPALMGLLHQGRHLDMLKEIKALHSKLGYSYWHIGQRLGDLILPNAIRQPLRRFAGRSSSVQNSWLNASRLNQDKIDIEFAANPRHSSVTALSRSMLYSRHLPMLLRWEDRNSMAHSVESRVPFLDHRLVEFNLSLPDDYKLHHGLTKRVMREATKNILPEAIRCRTDKIGFATPEQYWIKKQAPDHFKKALHEAIEQSDGILTTEALKHYEKGLEGNNIALSECWRMISFGLWMDRFSVSST